MHPIIKDIIEKHWKYIQKKTIIFVMMPFCIFMIFQYNYTIYDMESIQSLGQDSPHNIDWFSYGLTCRCAMLVLVFYFFLIDLYQVYVIGFKNFVKQYWNLPNICVFYSVVAAEIIHGWNARHQSDDEEGTQRIDKVVRSIYAVSTVFMWMKFLYFFRMVRSTGYYIRMVIEVCKDVWNFLFIFLVVILCFAQAYYIFLLNS